MDHSTPLEPIRDGQAPFLRVCIWATMYLQPCLPTSLLSHPEWSLFQEIQSLLTNWKGPDLTSYGELVLEGTFRIQRAKNERTLFLFDKLLLITKKRDDTFTYKAHILVGLSSGGGGEEWGVLRSLPSVPHPPSAILRSAATSCSWK